MFKSENLHSGLEELAAFIKNTVLRKIAMCFVCGYVAAKMSFVSWGGNIYLTADNFDPDMLPLWLQRVFRVSSIISLPIHILMAVLGFMYFLVSTLIIPTLIFTVEMVYGLSMLAIESLQRFVPARAAIDPQQVQQLPPQRTLPHNNGSAQRHSSQANAHNAGREIRTSSNLADMVHIVDTDLAVPGGIKLRTLSDIEAMTKILDNDLEVRGSVKMRRKRPNGTINAEVVSDSDIED